MINIPTLRPSLLYYNNQIQIPNYIFTENWEAPGMENGWVLGGVAPSPPDDMANETTTGGITYPVPAEGSYYLAMRHDNVYYSGHNARLFYTVENEVWGAFLFWKSNDTFESAPMIDMYLNSSPQHIIIMDNLALKVNTTTFGAPANSIAAETWTYVWFHYKKEPSAVFEVAFSTDGIKPTTGGNYFSTTPGLATDGILLYSADTIDLYPLHNTITLFDKIRLATSEIGSNYL